MLQVFSPEPLLKRLQHMFSCEYCKILRTPNLKSICELLLLLEELEYEYFTALFPL